MLLFVNEPPPWEILVQGAYRDVTPVVIVEYRKYYTNMSSIGGRYFFGEATGADLAEWITFWERTEEKRVGVRDLLTAPSTA